MANSRLLSAVTISLWLGSFCLAASAQVTPDGSLGTSVTGSPNFVINGGTRPSNGPNLFHSFRQFSIPTGGSASFNNVADVVNIFGRVTGGSVSTIDGAIRANGRANLFLINPAGILFGPNASLNIGGSFIGTTANSIKFANGAEFASTATPLPAPLLTVNVPIGLQFGTTPSPIRVEGTGFTLTLLNPLNPNNSPIDPRSYLTKLQLGVKPGHTLALIGGDISLTGGALRASDGRIELGSVGSGMVNLTAISKGWSFDYGNVSSFRDIRFSQRALADASGLGGGAIHIQGGRVSLADGSYALIQNRGSRNSEGITVRASDLLEVLGTVPNRSTVRSALRSEALGAGSPGDITVTTKQLVLAAGGAVSSGTYQSARSGKITIEATDALQVLGFSPTTGRVSTISTTTYSSGRAGDINLSTKALTVTYGGTIAPSSLGSGNAGNILINAAESIELSGFLPTLFAPSLIGSPSIFTGNAGDVTVNTKRLVVSNGGRLDSSITGSGKGGNLIINATDSIEVKGIVPGSRNPSLITTSATILDAALSRQLGVPSVPTGDSGSLTIHTGQLSVTDGGLVNVQNEGSGNGGTLRINADAVFLSDRGKITASAKSGEGGNLNLQVQQSVILRRGSLIAAESGGTGNGGNITISAPIIAGFENSDIIASAVRGRGGNIQITTQGIFGLKFRPQLTPENDITASSEFGVNGSVQITTPGIDPDSGLVALKLDLVDPSQQIATGCAGYEGSSFIATGRGGVPENPTHELISTRPWPDLRDLSPLRSAAAAVAPPPAATVLSSHPPLLEANAIRRHADGTVELVAEGNSAGLPPFATCAKAAALQSENP
jgi:filamentous hemagglutinin family protein